MGITFAILNWDGTTPVLRDNLRTWKRGFTITEIVCLIKFEDTPVWSGVFLSNRSLVASRTSSFVRFLSLNLKLFRLCAIRPVGSLLDMFILLTVLVAISLKNLLKWQAIESWSSMSKPFVVKCDIILLFLLFLFIVEKRICHVTISNFSCRKDERVPPCKNITISHVSYTAFVLLFCIPIMHNITSSFCFRYRNKFLLSYGLGSFKSDIAL